MFDASFCLTFSPDDPSTRLFLFFVSLNYGAFAG